MIHFGYLKVVYRTDIESLLTGVDLAPTSLYYKNTYSESHKRYIPQLQESIKKSSCSYKRILFRNSNIYYLSPIIYAYSQR